MKRVIVLVADEDGPDMNTRIGCLAAAADGFGFGVVRNAPVPDDAPIAQIHTPGSTPLMAFASHEDEQYRVLNSGVVSLLDLTGMTAYEAWKKLGGKRLKRVGHGARRGPGNLFHAICRAMVEEGLKFTDLDPANFRQYDRDAWEGYSDDPRTVSILHYVEVLDTHILKKLQDEDIKDFVGCTRAYRREIQDIRDRLNAGETE